MPKRFLPRAESPSLLIWFLAILAISVFAFFNSEQASRQAKKLAVQSRHLAVENKHRIREIQNVRKSNRDRISRTDKYICIRFSVPIEKSLHDSLKQLPTISYYKQHPDELKAAIQNTKKTIKLFDPKKCDKLPTKGLK
jgi:hypothetical protein